jgi:hypothetical protein
MDPRVIESFIPIVFFLVCAIPLLGVTIRIAAKPVVEAFVRFREVQAQHTISEQTLQLQERRVQLLESEVEHLRHVIERLAEAEQFRAQLEAPSRAELAAAGER